MCNQLPFNSGDLQIFVFSLGFSDLLHVPILRLNLFWFFSLYLSRLGLTCYDFYLSLFLFGLTGSDLRLELILLLLRIPRENPRFTIHADFISFIMDKYFTDAAVSGIDNIFRLLRVSIQLSLLNLIFDLVSSLNHISDQIS